MSELIIAVDFDGTIVDHRYPAIGQAVPGVFPWLKRFQALGARLILWTMRSDTQQGGKSKQIPTLTKAVEFCRQNGIKFWGVNQNPEQSEWTESPKQHAHIYIDDAAFGCPLIPGPLPDSAPVVDWSIVGPAIGPAIERLLNPESQAIHGKVPQKANNNRSNAVVQKRRSSRGPRRRGS